MLILFILSFKGPSINSFDLHGRTFPFTWGGDAANYSAGGSQDLSKYCITGYMNSYKVEGKIVFCETLWDGIITDYAFNYPLPATQISSSDGEKVFDYIKSTE